MHSSFVIRKLFKKNSQVDGHMETSMEAFWSQVPKGVQIEVGLLITFNLFIISFRYILNP